MERKVKNERERGNWKGIAVTSFQNFQELSQQRKKKVWKGAEELKKKRKENVRMKEKTEKGINFFLFAFSRIIT